jgi:hypothetical protein
LNLNRLGRSLHHINASAGCLLRVVAEPLAYENIWAPAWSILPSQQRLNSLP